MDKLDEILAHKRQEIAPKARIPADAEFAAQRRERPGFLSALAGAPGVGVIAEIKRRSPSSGAIAAGISAVEQALRYRAAGADCLSILTDQAYFGGHLADLTSVVDRFQAQAPALPALRKDFMVHPIQILEAAQAGASCILLIVRALEDAELREFNRLATLAGLDVLFETHTEREIDRAVDAGARMIGINNRDLAIFKTDLGLSERLIPRIPGGILPVSESGLFTREDAARVRAAGARALLVGEALMKSAAPAALIRAFKGL